MHCRTQVQVAKWDLNKYRTLKVTRAMNGADKPTRNILVITNFEALRLTIYEIVTADITPSGIIILQLLAGTEALYRHIRLKYRYDFGFPINMATDRHKNGIKIRIENKWRLNTILVIIKFDLRQFRA